jgi:hypothetical protein
MDIALTWRNVVSFLSEFTSSFRLINKEQESKTVEEEHMGWDELLSKSMHPAMRPKIGWGMADTEGKCDHET